VTRRKRFGRLVTRLGCLGVLAVVVIIVMGELGLTVAQSVGVVVAGTLLLAGLALLAAWVERLYGKWRAP
jgi:hypothetical protein